MYLRVYTRTNTLLICFVLWFATSVLQLPAFFGLGDYTYVHIFYSDFTVNYCQHNDLREGNALSYVCQSVILSIRRRRRVTCDGSPWFPWTCSNFFTFRHPNLFKLIHLGTPPPISPVPVSHQDLLL